MQIANATSYPDLCGLLLAEVVTAAGAGHVVALISPLRLARHSFGSGIATKNNELHLSTKAPQARMDGKPRRHSWVSRRTGLVAVAK